MQKGKPVFALLAGIFLLAFGSFSLLNMLLFGGGGITIIGRLDILLGLLYCLVGLFLLLRKPLPAAILMSAAALVMGINTVSLIRFFAEFRMILPIAAQVLSLLALILFAVGLYGKRVFALIMCLIAAGLYLLSPVIDLALYRSLNFSTLRSLFMTFTLIAAMVFAGLYLFSLGKEETPRY